MPVFNEEASIGQVVATWLESLSTTLGEFLLIIVDDGSSDSTPRLLSQFSSAHPSHIRIIRHENRGHGLSCIAGYRAALATGATHILQIDSDGQSDPSHFPDFWEKRDEFDVIYGKRNRKDGINRIIASHILRISLRTFAGARCTDANVPYRLMRISGCKDAILSVPDSIYLSNIALAVILRKDSSIRHGDIPINFPPRIGGEPSVPFWKFAGKGFELFTQLKKAGIR